MAKKLCLRCQRREVKRGRATICDYCKEAELVFKDPKVRERIRKAEQDIKAGRGIRYVIKNGKLRRR